MNPSAMHTHYLPAERASGQEIEADVAFFSSDARLTQLADALPHPFVALNRHRQIVFANEAFVHLTAKQRTEEIHGLRPGEALRCIHSDETPGGCGTTEFCRTCGAARAIAAAISGRRGVKECRITNRDGESLDLRVWASPWVDREGFMSFNVENISHEKRRRALERIFFHDVLNTASGVQGLADLLKEESDPTQARDLTELIRLGAHTLVDEIQAQRALAAAETGELTVQPETVRTEDLLNEVMAFYRNHLTAEGRTLRLHPQSESIPIITDPVLVRRVIGNMVKNALEASSPGETVTLGSRRRDDRVELWVHNRGIMARESQLQVFQRSFSTKGKGRGLGTYSIRLLTERYLKGHASFTSTEAEGTTFRIRLPMRLE